MSSTNMLQDASYMKPKSRTCWNNLKLHMCMSGIRNAEFAGHVTHVFEPSLFPHLLHLQENIL